MKNERERESGDRNLPRLLRLMRVSAKERVPVNNVMTVLGSARRAIFGYHRCWYNRLLTNSIIVLTKG